MNKEDIIKLQYPDNFEGEITVECMERVIRRANIGKAVEALAIPTIIVIVGVSIWKVIKIRKS